MNKFKQQTILLAVPPYWDPLLPPLGIASIKRYLQSKGYKVRAVDLNLRAQLLETYSRYFDLLREYVPEDNRGNFYSIGHFVLQNQMMAHFNHEKEEEKYNELVKILVYKTFFVHIDDSQVAEMNKLLDEHYSFLRECTCDLLKKEDPCILGLTVNTGTYPSALFMFRLAKSERPDIKTIMGGNIFADQLAVGSPNYQYLLKISKHYLDKIMIGQGESLLYRYLEGELDESRRVYTNKDLNGTLLTFSQLEVPDLSDYDVEEYPYIGATGSISCKHQCSFCNSVKYYGKYRQKDMKLLVSQMTELYHTTGKQLFFMTDGMLNPIIDEFSEELLNTDTAFYYDGYFRVDEASANVENTLKWRRSGFYRARLGVESGSQDVLDSMGKGITVEQTKAAVAGLAYAGIKTTTYWVVGLPGETEEDFQQTLALLEELRNDIWQAEVAQFDYYYDGQAASAQWADKRMLLYPQWANKMLVSRSWILNCPPSREETYQRIFRFVRHCKKLGIPNPYSLTEIKQADERWQRLHKNAVPPMLEFKKGRYIDERNKVQKLLFVRKEWKDEGDFSFQANL